MKTKLVVALSLVAVVLVSCGPSRRAQYPYGYPPQQPYPPQYQQPYQQQYQPQRGQDEAGFYEMKKSPVELLAFAQGTGEIRAYGAADAGTESLALREATARAQAALVEKIEVYVRTGLDAYQDEVGVNSQYSLDESTKDQVVTGAKRIVEGITTVDSRKLYNPTTKRYKYEICVKYDRAAILSAMQKENERIAANEAKFEKKMQSVWDELDAKNERESLGEQQQRRQNAMQQDNMDRQHQRNMEYQNQQNQYYLESQRINAPYQQAY